MRSSTAPRQPSESRPRRHGTDRPSSLLRRATVARDGHRRRASERPGPAFESRARRQRGENWRTLPAQRRLSSRPREILASRRLRRAPRVPAVAAAAGSEPGSLAAPDCSGLDCSALDCFARGTLHLNVLRLVGDCEFAAPAMFPRASCERSSAAGAGAAGGGGGAGCQSRGGRRGLRWEPHALLRLPFLLVDRRPRFLGADTLVSLPSTRLALPCSSLLSATERTLGLEGQILVRRRGRRRGFGRRRRHRCGSGLRALLAQFAEDRRCASLAGIDGEP